MSILSLRNLFRSGALSTVALWASLTMAMGAAGSSGQLPSEAAAQVVSPEAMTQIDALLREKDARRGVELKLDSRLIYELRMWRGQPIAQGVAAQVTDVPRESDNRIVVDVNARVTDALVLRIRNLGAEVIDANARAGTMRVRGALTDVEAIAAMSDVSFVQPKQQAMTQHLGRASERRAAGQARGALRPLIRPFDRSAFAGVLAGAGQIGNSQTQVGTAQGSKATEGDATHRAFAARGTFHVDGTGIKIGVLSDSACNIAASQALGDLGPVTVLAGQTGDCASVGDEGTAMLEIIHDMAPGAQLYFATAFTSIASFGDNIRALRTAGCDIIVDDVFYFVESTFQDGQTGSVVSPSNGGYITQAVKDVTASGALYFSSAGNQGNLDAGTSGVWEGDFVDGGAIAAPIKGTGRLHSFGATKYDVINVTGGSENLLTWSDPLGGSANDYDLFLLNSTGTTVLGSSTNIQSGTQDPLEEVAAGAANNRLVIVKRTTAAARYLHLTSFGGSLSIKTAGQTFGHSSANSTGAFSVAATPAAAAFDGVAPVGPYPNPFNSSNVTETYTSDGPRRIFFTGAGAAITAGNFSSTGGQLLSKPDITAADGVSVTGVGGFPTPFYGTSAAAPTAAAIAGLIKSFNPSLTQAQIRTALVSSAIDIQGAGVDRDSGSGIVMAFQALQSVGATGGPFLAATTPVAAESPGNGNGVVNVGEGATLAVPITNLGLASATAISATLTTSTPGISITLPGTSAYPNIAVGATASNSTPFRFTLLSNAACPLVATFTLTLTYSGGGSPAVVTFDAPIGPGFSISTTLDASAPVGAGSGVTATTGQQTGRLNRSGAMAVCGTTKASPGLFVNTGSRQYDSYTMALCPEATSGCATVSVSAANGANLYSVAYKPSFTPAHPATNFLADAGVSGTAMSYGMTVGPGPGTIAIVVHDVNVTPASGSAYTLKVSNLCAGACATPNHVPVAVAQNVTVTVAHGATAAVSINNGSSDADGDTLTITQSPAGPYAIGTWPVLLTVTDPKGATSQATGVVTVNELVSIAAQPSNQTVTAGQTATFTAAANGSPVATVQWQKKIPGGSMADIPGATSTTLSFTTAVSDNGNQYRAIFTNSLNSVTTNIVTLTVNSAPAFTTSPSNQTVNAGSNASFTVVASGNPAPSYQWQVSTNGGSSFGNLANAAPYSGVTTTTLTVTGVTAGLSGNQYRCLATNTVTTTASVGATLTVNTPPTITTIANQATAPNTPKGPIAFTVGDAETAAGSLVVSGSSSNTTVVPNANVTFGGSGANRTVTVTPATNQSGTTTITVSVSDGSLSNSTSFLLIVASLTYPDELLGGGPLAYWRLGESGGATLADSSGNGRTAVLPSVTFGVSGATGGTGLALTQAQADLATPIDLMDASAPVSFEFWVRPSLQVGDSYGGLLVDNDPVGFNSYNNGFFLQNNGGSVNVNAFFFTDQTNTTPLTPGVLYHIVAAVSGAGPNNGHWYVNGVADGVFTYTGMSLNRLFTTYNNERLQAALIDEMAVYKGTTLSASQAATHHSLTGASYASAVLADGATAYWQFDEASGTALADATGNGHTAVLPSVTFSVPGALGDGTTGLGINQSQADLATPINLTSASTPATFEFWVKPSAQISDGYGGVLVDNDPVGLDSYNNGFFLQTSGGGTHVNAFFFMDQPNLTPLTLGTRYHIVAVVNGAGPNNGQWYLNGVPDGTFTYTGMSVNRLFTTYNNERLQATLIDEIAIYGTALSATEVMLHYTLGTSGGGVAAPIAAPLRRR